MVAVTAVGSVRDGAGGVTAVAFAVDRLDHSERNCVSRCLSAGASLGQSHYCTLYFIQVTTPANALISRITDRMPAILQPWDWATWWGERDTFLADVKAVLRTFEDNGGWTMTARSPTRKAKPRADPSRACFRWLRST
jgi:hypothetical protein